MADRRAFQSLKSILTTPSPRPAGVSSGTSGGVAVSGPSDAERAAMQAADVARAAQQRAAEEAARAQAEARAAEEMRAEQSFREEPGDAVEIAENVAAEDEVPHDGSYDEAGSYREEVYTDEEELVAEYHDVEPEASVAAREIDPNPPRARFADVVVYDGSFDPVRDAVSNVISEAVNELARLRARAAEAYEVRVETMLADLATTVLARELSLAPADIADLVRRALSDFAASGPVAVRVSPEQADALSTTVPVVADEALSVGDLIVDVQDGALDLRLGTRIAAILRTQMVHL